MLSHIDIPATVQVGNVTIGLDLGEPCAKSREIASLELRENPETRQKGLEVMKNILDGKANIITAMGSYCFHMIWITNTSNENLHITVVLRLKKGRLCIFKTVYRF